MTISELRKTEETMKAAVLIFLQFFSFCSAVELKVGIYNEIPDLGNDGLASYKAMIESGFNSDDHTVNAVVDPAQYSPYGNLKDYLSVDGFDLIEMDTANLKEVVEDDLLIKIPTNLPDDIMPAAVSAVMINGHLYAYPTLVCGNFLIGLTPDSCPLRDARKDYDAFFATMEECKSGHTWERLLGGKMNDESGWYLPYIYVDGYIDIHGAESVQKAVDEVVRGVVDPVLCERLSWYISCCNDNDGEDPNKCYYDFPGSYVDSSSNVYPDVQNQATDIYFGFSEKIAQVERDSERESFAAISGPLGEVNNLLQFTDALVINKARWNAANEEKKNVIKSFVQYFLSNPLREKIAMGTDLQPPRVRYLLQATKTFYEMTDNIVYRDLFWSLSKAAAAPSLTSYQKGKMQNVLTRLCVKLSQGKKSQGTKSREEL